jgi:dienelactone hydrolase
MNRSVETERVNKEQKVQVTTGPVSLDGNLSLPEKAVGLVLFAHGSGSSRFSPRNRLVAHHLQEAGLATLLIDLLSVEEEDIDRLTRQLRFDIELLARRLEGVTDWVRQQAATRDLKIGYFGASTGAAAALIAAADRADGVGAVVSRGGRPDLAWSRLHQIKAPTLLIVGGNDEPVIDLNQKALAQLRTTKRLEIIPGATHLFEEPGALEKVAWLARDWFHLHLSAPEQPETAA